MHVRARAFAAAAVALVLAGCGTRMAGTEAGADPEPSAQLWPVERVDPDGCAGGAGSVSEGITDYAPQSELEKEKFGTPKPETHFVPPEALSVQLGSHEGPAENASPFGPRHARSHSSSVHSRWPRASHSFAASIEVIAVSGATPGSFG